MKRLDGILSCIAAGMTTAALTGVLGCLVIWCVMPFIAGDPEDAFNFNGLGWLLFMGALVGGLFGAPPAVLVICFSRAREAPWRSLPILLAGTSIGLVVLGFPFEPLMEGGGPATLIAPLMCVVGPTLASLVAVRFLPTSETDRSGKTPM